MWTNPKFLADLFTFTEETLNGKLHFLCSGLWPWVVWWEESCIPWQGRDIYGGKGYYQVYRNIKSIETAYKRDFCQCLPGCGSLFSNLDLKVNHLTFCTFCTLNSDFVKICCLEIKGKEKYSRKVLNMSDLLLKLYEWSRIFKITETASVFFESSFGVSFHELQAETEHFLNQDRTVIV